MTTKNNLVRSKRSGFTITELLVAMALIVFIMSILAEAFTAGTQTYRELKATGNLSDNLREAALALRRDHNLNKRFPATLAEVFRVANFPANGEKDGYKIGPDMRQQDPQGGWILNASPEPGVTGSYSGQLHVFLLAGVPSYRIEFTPTPGASQGRARMFAAVRYHAAEAFAQLAYTLPYVEQDSLYRQVRSYLELPGMAEDASRKLTAPDGTITLGSIERWFQQGASTGTRADGSVRFILESFWDNVKKDLQLGKYGEQWMSLPAIVGPTPKIDFFSYSSLLQIVWQTPAVDQKVRELQGRLKLAEAASAQGDRVGEQAAMKGFLDTVAAGTTAKPPSISPLGAQILTSMGRAMYPY